MAQDREFRTWQERLRADLAQWQTRKADDYLLRGGPLTVAEEWLAGRREDLTSAEIDYIETSLARRQAQEAADEERLRRELEQAQQLAEEQKKARNRLRQIVGGLAAGLLIVGVLAVLLFGSNQTAQDNAETARQNANAAQTSESIAVTAQAESDSNAALAQSNEALALTREAEAEASAQEAVTQANAAATAQAEAEAQAQIAFSRQLAAQAVSELGGMNPDLPLLLAIEAGNAANTVEAFSMIQAAIAHPGQPLNIFQHEGAVTQASWNGDETRILTRSEDGTARVWDAESGAQLALLQHEGAVTQASWNGD
jgi:hypothetical protein